MLCIFQPLAAGSGIPELKTYLNGVHIRGLLQVRTFITKIVGVMFSISAGLIAGKEGPFVHGGGIVGGGLGGMGSRTLTMLLKDKVNFKSSRWFGGYFRNDAVGAHLYHFSHLNCRILIYFVPVTSAGSQRLQCHRNCSWCCNSICCANWWAALHH